MSHLNRTAIGIGSSTKELLKEGLVEVVDRVIKGQEHKLWDVFWCVASGDRVASAIAVWQPAVAGITSLLGLSRHQDDNHAREQCQAWNALHLERGKSCHL